jgi:hypothetical protein
MEMVGHPIITKSIIEENVQRTAMAIKGCGYDYVEESGVWDRR